MGAEESAGDDHEFVAEFQKSEAKFLKVLNNHASSPEALKAIIDSFAVDVRGVESIWDRNSGQFFPADRMKKIVDSYIDNPKESSVLDEGIESNIKDQLIKIAKARPFGVTSFL